MTLCVREPAALPRVLAGGTSHDADAWRCTRRAIRAMELSSTPPWDAIPPQDARVGASAAVGGEGRGRGREAEAEVAEAERA
jgi:hypothetical protein